MNASTPSVPIPMRRHTPIRNAEVLKQRLDALVATMDISTISPDPLELVLRYTDPRDQEIAGIIAAAFAYGRADIVVRNGAWILERMKPSPYAYLADVFTRAEAKKRFAGFSHRFHKTPELVLFLERIAGAIRRVGWQPTPHESHGGLGELFRRGYRDEEEDIGPALARFVDALVGGSDDKALRYLLTSPEDGSACKRMNLFLRWMIRRESPDLGIWTFADPAKLIIPLDTHIHRITAFLGLNRRKSADWKSAHAITERLRLFDPADPVRYDFAICRLGILDLCSRKRRREQCDVCQLRDVCRFPVFG